MLVWVGLFYASDIFHVRQLDRGEISDKGNEKEEKQEKRIRLI